MSVRVYVRKFDWDEARRLVASGVTVKETARRLGVSPAAVRRTIDPEAKRRIDARARRWTRGGVCPDCGTQTTRRRASESSRCVKCATLRRTTSVREDTLWCSACQTWKPDAEFPKGGRKIRRGRSADCRDCHTKAKREYRARHQAPCENNCGRTAYTKERRDPTKPLLCQECALTQPRRRVAA